MTKAHADRNLLIGILALQLDFIRRDELVAALNAWVLDKERPLNEILIEQNALAAETEPLLLAVVEKHLEMNDGRLEKSLAAVSTLGSLAEELAELQDPVVDATLSMVAHPSSTTGDKTERPSGTRSLSQDDRFRLLRLHARGGLGEVSLAQDNELNREVAVKLLQDRYADDPANRDRFVAEAEITGSLEHPGIVPVYGLGATPDGRPFYAMRFIRGNSLREAAIEFHGRKFASAAERRLELRKLLQRFIDVCFAIEYAHSRGVLHRDLKPGNIMLGRFGETLVVDWGLAKAVGRQETATPSEEPTLHPELGGGSSHTRMGSAVGTPAYMSPEQAAGKLDELNAATDVYGLGATLFFLLTGKPPIEGKDSAAVLARVREGDLPTPLQVRSDIPRPLDAICRQAMRVDPADRYSSPRELADDVERWLADETVQAYSETWTERSSRWMRNHSAAVVAGGVIAAILILASVTLAIASDQFRRQIAEQKQEADEARQLAERNFGYSLQAVDQMLTRVAEGRLAGVPFMIKVREQLLNDAIKFYEETLPDAEQEAVSVRFQTAQTKNLLARCQVLLGRLDEALTLTEEAWTILESLKSELGERPGFIYSRVQNRYFVATAKQMQSKQDEAFAAIETGLENLRALDGDAPQEAVHLEIAFWNLQGNVYREKGQFEEALRAYDQAAAIRKSLEDQTEKTQLLYAAQAEHNLRGIVLMAMGDPAAAADEFRNSAKQLEELVLLGQTQPWVKSDQVSTQLSLAAALTRQGDLAGAIEALQTAKGWSDELVSLYPGERSHAIYAAATRHNLGEAYNQQGRFNLAIPLFRESIDALESLRENGSLAAAGLTDLANSYSYLGRALIATGKLDEAQAAMTESRELWEQLHADSPDSLSSALGAASTHHNLADLQVMRNQHDEAIAGYQRSIERLTQALDRFGPELKILGDLANSYMQMGLQHFRRNETAKAEVALKEAAERFAKVNELQPSVDVKFAQGFAASIHNWAMVQKGRSDYEEAAEGFRQSIQAISALDPEQIIPPLAADLANSHLKLGECLAKLKQYEEAAIEFQEATQRFEQLKAGFPQIPQFMAQYAATRHNHGLVLFELKQWDAAEDAFQDSINTLQPLVMFLPHLTPLRVDLANSHEMLARTLAKQTQNEDASEHIAKALEIVEGLIRDIPEDPGPRFLRSALRMEKAIIDGSFAKAREVADGFANAESSADDQYNAACLDGRLLEAAAEGRVVADEGELESLRQRAVERLRNSRSASFFNAAKLETDSDLNGLRDYEPFQQLQQEVQEAEAEEEQ